MKALGENSQPRLAIFTTYLLFYFACTFYSYFSL